MKFETEELKYLVEMHRIYIDSHKLITFHLLYI